MFFKNLFTKKSFEKDFEKMVKVGIAGAVRQAPSMMLEGYFAKISITESKRQANLNDIEIAKEYNIELSELFEIVDRVIVRAMKPYNNH